MDENPSSTNPFEPTRPPQKPKGPHRPGAEVKEKKSLISFLKKPLVLAGGVIILVLAMAAISVNDVMKALLHSRPEVLVPEIEKKSVLDALTILSEVELTLVQDGSEFDESLPAGTIIRQHPPVGMRVRTGRPVRVILSKGGQVLFIPAIVGEPIAEVQSKLARDGLQLGTVEEIYSVQFARGIALSQNPSPGTIVTRGALIDVVVSAGNPPSGMPVAPDFVNNSIEIVNGWADANNVQLKVKEDPTANGSAGTVVSQKPPVGQPVLDNILEVVIVPLLASEQGFRFSYNIPEDEGSIVVRIKGRSNRGEYQIYEGRHTGGEKIEIPMSVESTTRVRIYLNDRLAEERVVEP